MLDCKAKPAYIMHHIKLTRSYVCLENQEFRSELAEENVPNELSPSGEEEWTIMISDDQSSWRQADELTSSTLSDSTQMTLSNVSSQQMSLSMHSEVSAISQLTEEEKHELEATVESETEEITLGFDEMSASIEQTQEVVISPVPEKCVEELHDSEKHVRFPDDDTTTDVLYTNEQLESSQEEVVAAEESSLSEDVPETFAHCSVDELSHGPPKEKYAEEEKELSSMASSMVTSDSGGVVTPLADFLSPVADEPEEIQPDTPTGRPQLGKRVSFDDEDVTMTPAEGDSVDFRDLELQHPDLFGVHKALSYTSSMEVQPPSDIQSLQSDLSSAECSEQNHDWSPEQSSSNQQMSYEPSTVVRQYLTTTDQCQADLDTEVTGRIDINVLEQPDYERQPEMDISAPQHPEPESFLRLSSDQLIDDSGATNDSNLPQSQLFTHSETDAQFATITETSQALLDDNNMHDDSPVVEQPSYSLQQGISVYNSVMSAAKILSVGMAIMTHFIFVPH